MPPKVVHSGTVRVTRRWKLLLLLPYLGLCFPSLYARATPALFGFPFFYWYQFVWVALTSAILGIYYLRASRPNGLVKEANGTLE